MRRFGERVGCDDGQAAFAHDAPAFLDIRASQSNDEGHAKVLSRPHNTFCDPIAAIDAGEDINQNRLHVLRACIETLRAREPL